MSVEFGWGERQTECQLNCLRYIVLSSLTTDLAHSILPYCFFYSFCWDVALLSPKPGDLSEQQCRDKQFGHAWLHDADTRLDVFDVTVVLEGHERRCNWNPSTLPGFHFPVALRLARTNGSRGPESRRGQPFSR